MPNALTAETRKTVVQNTARLLRENYAFPETAENMAARVQEKLKQGSYDDIANVTEFCRALTADLHVVAQDLHLVVYHHPGEAVELARLEEQADSDEDETLHWWTQVSADNYGFKRVECLTGNIGYLDLRYFAPVSLGGETAVAAMNFVAHSDALIFDLRQNGGGDPFMVQLVESYLFGGEPKLLLTMYDRPKDKRQQIWTLPHVPGKRLPDVPVYALTSGSTFSGGEDFTYTLKHHGRATVVGEATGGGGHTVDFKVVHEGFVICLPTGYPTHPVTGSSWEGTGVEPDICVPQERALQTAHVHALETLLTKSQDDAYTRRLEWDLETVQATYAQLEVEGATLARYVGQYGNWIVALKDGAVCMSRQGRRDDWKLTPITETFFVMDEGYKIRFVVAEGGEASALVFLGRDDGREVTIPRASG
ncbi:MAG: S41 family peptidase [Anaerolineae bacterium]|jgi:C-terminal processing protease CtpA/Prc